MMKYVLVFTDVGFGMCFGSRYFQTTANGGAQSYGSGMGVVCHPMTCQQRLIYQKVCV